MSNESQTTSTTQTTSNESQTTSTTQTTSTQQGSGNTGDNLPLRNPDTAIKSQHPGGVQKGGNQND